jgi:hypothetical protein
LEEHRVCNAKVTGSSPVASTTERLADPRPRGRRSLKTRQEAFVEENRARKKIQAEKRAWRMIWRPEPKKDVA